MRWMRSIPNFLTLTHLFLGAWGAAEAVAGRLLYASILGLVATLFDFLDGMAARALDATSERGKQLDSLADVVSFGVLPSLVMMRLMALSNTNWMQGLYLGSFPVFYFIPFVGTLAAAWRLSGFNLQASSRIFYGLPSPAHALFLFSLPLMLRFGFYIIDVDTIIVLEPLLLNPWFLIFISLFTAGMMVAPYPLYSLKMKPGGLNQNRALLIVVVTVAVLLVVLSFAALPLLVLAYILLSIIKKPQSE